MGCTPSAPQVTSDDKLSNTYRRARLAQNLVQQTNKVDPFTKYDVVQQIGVGSMGHVSTVRAKGDDEQHHLYAMKTLRQGRMTREFVAELKNEIRSIRRLDHFNIVRFHEVYYGKQIAIIMDYCSGGDLYGRIPYTETQAATIMRQVLEALGYMHRQGFVHLDIKCDNIMFASPDTDATVKIIDFGFAQRLEKDSMAHKQLGTFDTMAPEVFGGNYNSQADLWSAGVVAFELISGRKPFAAASPMGVIGKIASGEIFMNDKRWKEKTAASKAFVKALLKKDPEKRLDADGALRHKWIRQAKTSNRARSKSTNSIGDTIMKFGQAPTLKKIGLIMIAHKTFPEEVVKLKREFSRFDLNQSGVVSYEDFRTALLEINQEYREEDILPIFEALDTYENGEISYTEFVAAALEKYVHLTEHRIDDAFERLDVTNSGFISTEDLRLVLGKDFTDEKAQEMISQIDTDGDGQVSKQEFLAAFSRDRDRLQRQLSLSQPPLQ